MLHMEKAPHPRHSVAMNDQLKAVADSYDRGIDLGRNGIDPYKELPESITASPGYTLFRKMQQAGALSDSGREEIRTFLAPRPGMRFIDLGCCLNLMFRGHDQWESLYHGVDISPKTIELLQRHVQRNHLQVGALVCGSMHDTPFGDDAFDIGACVGSIEYFEREFVHRALKEIARIIKPGGRLVLDIPDVGSPEFGAISVIEDYLGRPEKFNMTIKEFEAELRPCWAIAKKEKVGPMLQYFLWSTR